MMARASFRIADDAYFRLRGWIPMPLYAASIFLMAHDPPRPWEVVLGPWLVPRVDVIHVIHPPSIARQSVRNHVFRSRTAVSLYSGHFDWGSTCGPTKRLVCDSTS